MSIITLIEDRIQQLESQLEWQQYEMDELNDKLRIARDARWREQRLINRRAKLATDERFT